MKCWHKTRSLLYQWRRLNSRNPWFWHSACGYFPTFCKVHRNTPKYNPNHVQILKSWEIVKIWMFHWKFALTHPRNAFRDLMAKNSQQYVLSANFLTFLDFYFLHHHLRCVLSRGIPDENQTQASRRKYSVRMAGEWSEFVEKKLFACKFRCRTKLWYFYCHFSFVICPPNILYI